MGSEGGLVWSSKHGRTCPGCGQPVAKCACDASGATPTGDGVVRVAIEKKGRRGKTVTVVTGVPLDAAKLTKLGKRLKKKCGSGGTVRDGVIEIQGDHRDAIVAALEAEGYTVRRSGG
ncbi:MAG: translation initiation factor Sui1 [Planctomycetota bacterium]